MATTLIREHANTLAEKIRGFQFQKPEPETIRRIVGVVVTLLVVGFVLYLVLRTIVFIVSDVKVENVSMRKFVVAALEIDSENPWISISISTAVAFGVALNTTSDLNPLGNTTTVKLTQIGGLGVEYPLNAVSRTNFGINQGYEQLIETEVHRYHFLLPEDKVLHFRVLLADGFVLIRYHVVIRWHLKKQTSMAIFDHKETHFNSIVTLS